MKKYFLTFYLTEDAFYLKEQETSQVDVNLDDFNILKLIGNFLGSFFGLDSYVSKFLQSN
jgi:hypothetical protein